MSDLITSLECQRIEAHNALTRNPWRCYFTVSTKIGAKIRVVVPTIYRPAFQILSRCCEEPLYARYGDEEYAVADPGIAEWELELLDFSIEHHNPTAFCSACASPAVGSYYRHSLTREAKDSDLSAHEAVLTETFSQYVDILEAQIYALDFLPSLFDLVQAWQSLVANANMEPFTAMEFFESHWSDLLNAQPMAHHAN